MSEEALSVANTPTSDAATPAAAPAAAPAPATDAPAPAAAPEQQTPAAQTTDAPADKPAADTPAEDPTKPVTPEKYEFKAPEGVELTPEVLGEFEGVARELGLSQEAAQGVVEKMGLKIAAGQMARAEAAKAEWAESSKTDKEFGGDQFSENLAVAKKAVEAFGSPALSKLLADTGLGNHPEIIRAFYRAGKQISSGAFVPAGGGMTAAKDAASALYPNQK
jgi:hypothetical protein